MTKKDFQKFADMFAGELALARNAGSGVGEWQVENIIYSTADIFSQANPRFDRQRFYVASGLTPKD